MSNTVFQRRQAERFAQLLDTGQGAAGRHSWSPLDQDLIEPVALASALGAVPMPDAVPDPEFRSSLRAMLVATAEREGIGHRTGEAAPVTVPPVRPPRRARRSARRPLLGGKRVRAALVIGVASGALALSGISVASGDAMPGDPLYGIKRSTENARLALTGSEVDRGRTYLSFARTRGVEANAVRANSDRLGQALADMDSETIEGAQLLTTAAFTRRDSGPLDLLDDFVEAQRPVVSDLVASLSGDSLARARQSLDLLDRIDKRSTDLRASLSCPPGDSRTDDLGPLPARCSPAATRPTHSHSDPHPDGTPTTPAVSPGSASPSAPVSSPSGPAPSVSVSPGPEQDGGLLGIIGRLLGL